MMSNSALLNDALVLLIQPATPTKHNKKIGFVVEHLPRHQQKAKKRATQEIFFSFWIIILDLNCLFCRMLTKTMKWRKVSGMWLSNLHKFSLNYLVVLLETIRPVFFVHPRHVLSVERNAPTVDGADKANRAKVFATNARNIDGAIERVVALWCASPTSSNFQKLHRWGGECWRTVDCWLSSRRFIAPQKLHRKSVVAQSTH